MSLISRAAAPEEQGTVQGVAGSLESLGRALGPVWGNGLLGLYGEGPALSSVAALLMASGFVMLSPRGRTVDEILRSQTFEAVSSGAPGAARPES